jgi:hypothetical protein
MTAADRIAAARRFARAGWTIIPLRLGAESKAPRDKDWTTRDYDSRRVAEQCAREGRNFGGRVPDGWVVVDDDPRNRPAGRDTLAEFCAAAGLDLDAAPSQVTGSGGRHYFFRVPPGTRVRNDLPEFPGVEFKAAGRQVVLDTSTHPATGRAYEWDPISPELADAPPLPASALAMIAKADSAAAAAEAGAHSAEEVAAMLDALDPAAFAGDDAWLRLAMACHHASGGDACEEFLDWSARDPAYGDDFRERNRARWESFSADADGPKVTYRTLYKLLSDAGRADAIPRGDAADDFEGADDGADGAPARRVGGLEYALASEVEQRPVRWLWPGRFASGKMGILAGFPDTGKTNLACDIAARVSAGLEWPDGSGRAERGRALFMSAEDDPADTLAPRLQAAGADLANVAFVGMTVRTREGARMLNLGEDLDRLSRLVDALGGVRLLVIDPISAYLGGRIDGHRNTEVRAVLSPVGEWAERHGAAVVCVTHFNKGGSGRALYRITDSLAFTASARTAWVVVEERDDVLGLSGRKLMLKGKNNLAGDPGGLAYRLEGVELPGGVAASRVAWDGAVSVSADEAMEPPQQARRSPARDSAAEFLDELLALGPVRADEAEAAAADAGHSGAAVRRARTALGVASTRRDGAWWWSIPVDGA